jgi:hypothetical protein
MRTKPLVILALASTLGSVSGCDLDVGDLNNPPLEELENTPDAVTISAATTGLIVGNRRNVAAANGLVSQLGILGRESYNFDTADPRYFGELLQGQLNQGSPFGGNFWTGPYINIRLAHTILRALDLVADEELSAASKSGIRGFAHTIQAMDLLEVIVTHDTNGAVIDTDKPLGQPLGAIVDKATVYAEIVKLLDGALPELDAGGMSFAFDMTGGYAGFTTPPTFRRLNRAIRARVAVYLEDYATALTALNESFINDNPASMGFDLDAGVYHLFSTATGDATNAMLNPNIYAHPSIATEAQRNGTTPDARLTAKTFTPTDDDGMVVTGAGNGVSSTLQFAAYQDPASRVPVIRNEELILLKAEALFFSGQVAPAMATLNVVRTESGGLLPLVGLSSEATFIDQLLYERRYSLLFEGGHRWIDLRRLGREMPVDNATDVRNVRYPIPRAECNARPNEPACEGGSTDG